MVSHTLANLPKMDISPDTLSRTMSDAAILRIPVGAATQDAAAAAIASLTLRYESLRAAGLQALRSLSDPPLSHYPPQHLRDVAMKLGVPEQPAGWTT